MKIYYFGIYDSFGGMEKYALNLIEGVKERENQIDFVFLVFNDSFSRKEFFTKKMNCTYIVLPNFKKHPILFYKRIKDLSKIIQSDDVIQLNVCSFRNYFLFKAASGLNCKKIIVSHYSKVNGLTGFLHYLNRRIFNKKFLNVAVSESAGKFMFKKNYLIIPNGINSNSFVFSPLYRDEIRKKYNINENTFLIGQVGRISKEKNQNFSLAICEYLSKKNFDFKMMLIGKGDIKHLKRISKRKRISDRVIFAGLINEEINRYYSSFDCLILPSKNEACPLTLFEGLSNGLACIYSNSIETLGKEFSNVTNLIRLPLKANKWAYYIELISKKETLKRENYVVKTSFEKDEFIEKYISLYK